MPLRIINTAQPTETAPGVHAATAAVGDVFIVEASGSLSATGALANGIHAVAERLMATIAGTVSAGNYGLYSNVGNSTVHVTASGSVFGSVIAVYLCGDMVLNQFRNNGTIEAHQRALVLEGQFLDVVNNGLIAAHNGPAVTLTAPKGGSIFVNTGTVLGGADFVHIAIAGSTGSDKILNTGFIYGDVFLGGGDNIFDSRFGLLDGILRLGVGTNEVWSGNGDDHLIVATGTDKIDTGAGADLIEIAAANANIVIDLNVTTVQDTGAGAKAIAGVEHVLSTGGGSQLLIGNAADNRLTSGSGDDTLDGGTGNDTLDGGAGTDSVRFSGDVGAIVDLNRAGLEQNTGQGFDVLSRFENLEGGAGADRFTGDGNANVLAGNGGNDTLIGGGGNDTLDGGAGTNTVIMSRTAADSLIADNGDGTFTISGPDGVDLVRSARLVQFADKTLALWNAAPTVLALSATQTAEDTLTGTVLATVSASDADGDAITYRLAATDGPFRIDGTSLVLAGALDFEARTSYSLTVTATDLFGLATSQNFTFNVTNVVEMKGLTLIGTPRADTLTGEAGNDLIYGLGDRDRLFGQAGNDKLFGGAGKDTLSGGTGQDVFVFDTRPNKRSNIDKITDFSVADDTIQLAKSIFKKVSKKGVLKSSDFYVGVSAHDANDHVIYNRKTGALYYDADGTGASAQVQIATLGKKLKMTYKDFFVV